MTTLCNDPITLGLIASMISNDAKRPIAKKLLQRIDFSAILQHTDRGSLLSRAAALQCDELAGQPTEPRSDLVAWLDQRLTRRES